MAKITSRNAGSRNASEANVPAPLVFLEQWLSQEEFTQGLHNDTPFVATVAPKRHFCPYRHACKLTKVLTTKRGKKISEI